jgi:hypothetical protein
VKLDAAGQRRGRPEEETKGISGDLSTIGEIVVLSAT